MYSSEKPIRIVLIGGSGYTGLETLRWLERHEAAEVVGLFGSSNIGPIDEIHPMLSGQTNLTQQPYSPQAVAECNADLAMLCVPHKVAMSYVPDLRALGLRVIDWSADYRLADAAVYEQWYCPHTDPAGLADAVYGLPEFFADKIAGANLVANPGCYPTCAILAIAPLLAAGLIEPADIVVNAISGITGAGRSPSLAQHFPERNENFEPYKIASHRHMPEMEQVLATLSGKEPAVVFVPHLCPMDRGMLCSIYANPAGGATEEKLIETLQAAYADKPFVRVRTDVIPATKYVADTNFCDVTARLAKGKVMIFAAIDNLLKGASTQAIQNMNIMFGLKEDMGLY
ncbi:MAG: N-acetyl-gamma-glutamyl-phosphate reductase [Phycisphaerae bacterium]|nr:N-acetyl-gamma-glutamyl-phosphate reductase [Phycisphaerae bacterium]